MGTTKCYLGRKVFLQNQETWQVWKRRPNLDNYWISLNFLMTPTFLGRSNFWPIVTAIGSSIGCRLGLSHRSCYISLPTKYKVSSVNQHNKNCYRLFSCILKPFSQVDYCSINAVLIDLKIRIGMFYLERQLWGENSTSAKIKSNDSKLE